MSAKIFFLPTLAPSFWPDAKTPAVQALIFWTEKAIEKELELLFPNQLKLETDSKYTHYFVRSFNNGVANPLGQSLSMLFDIPEEDIAVDQILLLENNKMDDAVYERMQRLWREPAIETLKIKPVSQWRNERSQKPRLQLRKDPSLEPMLPGDGDLEWTSDEETVLLDKAKSMGRPWTRSELELIAQTWSEHCKHKLFAAKIAARDTLNPLTNSLFKTHLRAPAMELAKKDSQRFLSLFDDNAGVISIEKPDGQSTEWGVAMKMETHNSPSAISPYGGSSTGVVGVHRDILGTGLGAMPVANWDVLCFEEPGHRKLRPKGALDPEVLRLGVVKGIEDGGNQSGIPTVQGSVVFHPNYAVKPLVYAGCLGILPKKFVQKDPAAGDRLYCMGGAVGLDGLRGAVMSSRDIRKEDFIGSMVQVANAFVQRRMTDFLLEARDKNLISCVTDNGAGGLASSVGEMARSTNGALIDLTHLRLKYQGLHGWERLLSESQERMTVATHDPDQFEALAARWGIPFDVFGELNDSGRLEVIFEEKKIVDIELDFLHEACPQLQLETEWTLEEERNHWDVEWPDQNASVEIWKSYPKMLASPHLCSREGVVRRFDHEVQGRTLRQPFAGRTQHSPQDGSLLEIYEAEAFITLSHGLAPWRKDIHENVLYSFDEALRSTLLAGGRLSSAALLDNFCWPDPLKHPRHLWRLVRSCEMLSTLCRDWEMAFISGKDSMKNNSKDFDIPPTLVISMVSSACAPENIPAGFFLRANDLVYSLPMIGASMLDSAWERITDQRASSRRDNLFKGLSAQEIARETENYSGLLKERYLKVQKAVSEGLWRSAKDISEGGLLHAIFEMSLGRELGVLFENPQPDPYQLLSEGLGGFVFAIDPHVKTEVEKLFPEAQRVGVVHKIPELVWRPGDESFDVLKLKDIYLKASQEGFWG